jgi:histidinol-phosphate/aromatic aminotransferase/cobyric acid decarboxylase-like protein
VSLACLRPDLPAGYPFQVSQLAHRAKLDQNESAVDLPLELKRELCAELAARAWNRYVQPADYTRAKNALAAAFGQPPERVALTVGADQAIEAAFLVGGGPGRRARWFEPTYPFIATAARRTSTHAEPVALGRDVDRRLDPAAVLAPEPPDLVALVSPNNPTGGLVADPVLDAALSEPRRLVLVDEAYFEVSGWTAAARLERCDNLFLARSLSKSMLAGVHVGCAIAHPEAIAAVERLYTAPYHMDAWQLLCAERYELIRPHVQAAAHAVRAERERVGAALRRHELEVLDGRANFLAFEVGARAAEVWRGLAQAGVRVRDLGGLPGLAGFLRVTIGTAGENDLFLEELGRLLGSAGPAGVSPCSPPS